MQAARHVVKGRGKIRQLLTASYGGACGEIAAASRLAAWLICSIGQVMRRASTMHKMPQTIRMTTEDSKNIVRMERI